MTHDFKVQPGFPTAQTQHIAALYWQAFRGKLGKILSPENKAHSLIASILDPSHAISAVDRDGRVLGVAGFKTDNGAFVDGSFGDMRAVYGFWGAAWRGVLLGALERKPEPGLLLMDGIFVAPEARGKGVGTALLDAIEATAAQRGCVGVRLDVIDTNPKAAALYRRKGFVEVGRDSTGPLKSLLGFDHAVRMEKRP